MAVKVQNPLLDAALAYLKRGWSAIPLKPRSKIPFCEWKGWQERLPSEKELRLLWARQPECNVGVCLGPVSGLIGLDIDGELGKALLEKLSGGAGHKTLMFSTGHGLRLLFRPPPQLVVPVRSFGRESEMLRILSKGSQTVMPPSIHPRGQEYRWLPGCGPGEVELEEAPEWLLKLALQEKHQSNGSNFPHPEPPAGLTGGRMLLVGDCRRPLLLSLRGFAFTPRPLLDRPRQGQDTPGKQKEL